MSEPGEMPAKWFPHSRFPTIVLKLDANSMKIPMRPFIWKEALWMVLCDELESRSIPSALLWW